MADPVAAPRWWNDRLERLLMALAVLVGTGLSVRAAVNQPYNQNEWVQIAPYDSWDPAVVTSGTRQPPLDPILGALLQHAFGVGQFQQRIVPVAAGALSLVLVALLLRRLGLHVHGTAALWLMATAPLFLRYNAYARPYALPMMLMLLCAYAGTRWLDEGRARWLVTAVAAGLLLPLARVPEPVVFLGSSSLVLGLAGAARWLPRRRSLGLAGGLLLALVSVGALTTLELGSEETASSQDSLIDLDLGRALDRVPVGLRELRDFVGPLYGDWFPWWPLTVLLVVLAVALPAAVGRLARTWWWLPLVLAPLVFLVAYHTVNPYPLDERHYRIRFAYFWVPSLVVAAAAASAAVQRHVRRVGGWLGPALVGALVVTQLPATYAVLTRDDAVDVAEAARVIEARVPTDGIVLYDGPSPEGHWRQPFFGSERFFTTDDRARVVTARAIEAGHAAIAPGAGEIHLLVLDTPCVDSVACDSPDHAIGDVAGWEVVDRLGRLTLYAPTEGQSGRSGTIAALEALAAAYGPGYDEVNREAAQRLR